MSVSVILKKIQFKLKKILLLKNSFIPKYSFCSLSCALLHLLFKNNILQSVLHTRVHYIYTHDDTLYELLCQSIMHMIDCHTRAAAILRNFPIWSTMSHTILEESVLEKAQVG